MNKCARKLKLCLKFMKRPINVIWFYECKVSSNETENWRILTNKEIYAIVKKPYHNRDNKAT
jgi:hypothetical protein